MTNFIFWLEFGKEIHELVGGGSYISVLLTRIDFKMIF